MSVTKMSDSIQNQTQLRYYRYTIPELLALSATVCLGFDLSKFTYEAARAGVIPSLGDCAMASKKSSASLSKTANPETSNSSDILVFTGTRPIQPNRQPHFPPPIERQKDEGFARFLKKHSSPTHNRVTAGGRIVPIEPRSPPPFVLSGNATNHPQAQSADRPLQESFKKNADLPWTMNTSVNHFFSAGETGDLDTRGSYAQNVANFQNGARQPNMLYGTAFGAQTNMSSPVSPERMPMQSQLAGGPVMPPVTYAQQSLNSMQTSMSNFATGGFVTESFVNGALVDYNQMAHSIAAQQGPTPLQTLMAWEQHYAQLDQQLKDIDRHRAMSNLDPRLAEQRRVIVQQRSDAKDTVRDLQAMLGVKRRLESSQDSWNPSFNVDAPVYIPQSALMTQESIAHRPSFEVNHASIIEKPRGYGQRRAIPIVPPPESDQLANARQDIQSLHPSREGSSASARSSSRSDSSVPKLEHKSTATSELLHSSMLTKVQVSQCGSLHSSSSRTLDRADQQSSPDDADRANSQEVVVVYPANDMPPGNLPEEYLVLIEAINRPKGTISKVRLLDNRVIDVEGQGLGLMSSPTTASTTGEGLSSASDPDHGSRTIHIDHDRKCATPLNQYGLSATPIGKENVSVTPKGHQKAATDAFLAQFNAVNDNMSLGTRPETQSLRTASNSQLRQYEQQTAEYYQRGLRTLASRENIPQLAYQTSASENKHGLAYSVADEKVFEGGDYANQDALNTKGYSVTSIQNVHAIRSLPNSFDGAVEARQSFQAQINAASKSRSPRFLRRFGANGGA